MKTSALFARVASIAILLFAFGVAVYRAKTLTIAHDEALTYEWFLDGGVYNVLKYNAANHVLQTLLAKPVVKVLGVSEFTMRIPTLFGTAVYLIAVYFLCRKLFGEGLVMLLTSAMLALNPPVMDFLAAARGYSLGLASLAIAMYCMAGLLERGTFDPENREWRWGSVMASVALALAFTANFTNLVPAVCLAATFAFVTLGGWRKVLAFRESATRKFAAYFVFPGVLAGLFILWPFLIQARLAQSKTQLDSASDALQDIFNASFLSRWTEDAFNNLGAAQSAAGSWQAKASAFGAFIFLPLLFGFVLVGLLFALRPAEPTRKKQANRCVVLAGAAIGCAVLTVALHFTIKVNYPFSRYCLFAVPLFTVGGMLAAQEISLRFPSTVLKGTGLVLAAALLLDYGLCVNVKPFRYNAYDGISRDLYQAIEKDALSQGLTSARVGGTWWYEPEINFYRLKNRANWMLPYDVKDRSYFWQSPGALEPAGYDYFVFVPASDPQLSGPGIRTIYHDEKTQATIIAIAHH
jgi:hypothetical protein